MTNIRDILDVEKLETLITDGYVSRRSHPTARLQILNYSSKTQYEYNWCNETILCRGLIVDAEGMIIARPFPKIFNYSEHVNGKRPPLPEERFDVSEKMDGCLAILYKMDGVPYIASRGSFDSEFAIEATSILRNKYMNFHYEDGCTYLFELISPISRIVLDYKGKRDLVLLDIIDNESGKSIVLPSHPPFPVVKNYPGRSIEDLKRDRPGHEGYVLKYIPSGIRVKIKHDEYTRLHRILTETSSTVVWEIVAVEHMAKHFPQLTAKEIGDYVAYIDKTKIQPMLDRKGKSMDSLLEKVPDEFYNWLHKLNHDLLNMHSSLIAEAKTLIDMTDGDRQAIVSMAKDRLQRSLAFGILDNKEASAYGLAWKHLKPEWTKPFAQDE